MSTRTMPYVYDASKTLTLYPQTCCACGVLFGLESGYDKQRRQDHRNFYCPNGHSQHYLGKTEAERLAEELAAARSLAQREARRRESAERSARAYKGQATKLRNHAIAGECPAGCGKTYKRLATHLAAKHPDWIEQAEDGHP